MRKFIDITEALNTQYANPLCVWRPTLNDGFELVQVRPEGEDEGLEDQIGMVYDQGDEYDYYAYHPMTGECIANGLCNSADDAKRKIEAALGLAVCRDA